MFSKFFLERFIQETKEVYEDQKKKQTNKQKEKNANTIS